MSRRYIYIKVYCAGTVTEEQFSQTLSASIVKYFGEIGLSQIAPKIIRYDSSKSSAVVAFAKDYAAELHAALAFITHVNESDTLMLPLKTSGTIRGLSNS